MEIRKRLFLFFARKKGRKIREIEKEEYRWVKAHHGVPTFGQNFSTNSMWRKNLKM